MQPIPTLVAAATLMMMMASCRGDDGQRDPAAENKGTGQATDRRDQDTSAEAPRQENSLTMACLTALDPGMYQRIGLSTAQIERLHRLQQAPPSGNSANNMGPGTTNASEVANSSSNGNTGASGSGTGTSGAGATGSGSGTSSGNNATGSSNTRNGLSPNAPLQRTTLDTLRAILTAQQLADLERMCREGR